MGESKSASQIEVAKQSGQERKQEALKRREEFVIKKSEAKLSSNVKSTQELHQQREEMIANQVLKMQEESKTMMTRYVEESKKREEMLKREQEMIETERKRKDELAAQRMKEQEEKQKQRGQSIQRQEALLKEEHKQKELAELRRKEEAKKQEELRLIEAKRQKDARKLQEERKVKMEADKAVEWERAQDLARQEELRRQQSQQIEALRLKAVQQQERATAKVEIKQYSSTAMRPGDFGYGNVTTGQVASRKYEILTRASSVGLSEREGLNPDLMSHSARASPCPAPLFPVAVPPGTMQMKSMATGEAEMSVQRSQQTSTALKADFAESTTALGSGLSRKQQQSSTVSKMTSSTMESSSSTQQMSMSSSQFSASSSSFSATQMSQLSTSSHQQQ